MPRTTRKITISMTPDELERCDRMARYRGMTRSGYLSDLVKRDSEVRQREVVLTRDGFTRLLVDRVGGGRELGRALRWVDSAMVLQNDVGRPVYVLETNDGVNSKDVEYLRDLLSSLGICACLVPGGSIGYVGALTAASMGDKDRQLSRKRKADEDGRR